MNFDEALSQESPPAVDVQAPSAPKGWEPGVRWSAASGDGELTTGDLSSEPTLALWSELIADWGFDPEVVEIVDGTVEVIGWDSPVKGTQTGEKIRLKRYKVKLRRRVQSREEETRRDVESLVSQVMKWRPLKGVPEPDPDASKALVVCLSDWQMGKAVRGTEGGGSEGTFDRILSSLDSLHSRIKDLVRTGRAPQAIYVVGLGDLVEKCWGNYPSQAFSTDLNEREQERIVRRLLLKYIDSLVSTKVPIVLTGVAGNHGERRENGEAFTDVTDNADLALIEQVGDILAANPERYSGVSVFLPDDLAMTLDIAGVPVGFFHGHVTSGGQDAAQRIEKWWTGQIVGLRPTVKDARILITGHYHHFLVTERVGRTHFQCPTQDPGSHWWSIKTGQNSPTGMLTLMVGSAYGERGWGDLAIL